MKGMTSEDRFWTAVWICITLIGLAGFCAHVYETHEYLKAGLCRTEASRDSLTATYEKCK